MEGGGDGASEGKDDGGALEGDGDGGGDEEEDDHVHYESH